MTLGSIFDLAGNFLLSYWWLIIAVIFLPTFASLKLFVDHQIKKRTTKWSLLDIKISREIQKTPQAMEQILSTIHGWGGKATDWSSLEVASLGGEIHFYVRVQEKLKNILESTFFSFYQDVDIKEASEDYAQKFPSNTGALYAQNLDVWGTELILDKEGIYPVRSYSEFSMTGGDEKHSDPFSVLVEVMGRIQKEETLAVQIILMPLKTKSVKEKYKAILDKFKPEKKKEGEEPKPKNATDQKVQKIIEENLSKPFFNVLIRLIYISPKAIFQENYAKQGLISAFNQYSSPDLNMFKSNDGVAVGGVKSMFFKKAKNDDRKAQILHRFKHREIPELSNFGRIFTSTIFHHNINSRFIELSVESLATIFHLPTGAVLTAPYMKRIESRKVGPPQGLAIFGGDKDSEIFE